MHSHERKGPQGPLLHIQEPHETSPKCCHSKRNFDGRPKGGRNQVLYNALPIMASAPIILSDRTSTLSLPKYSHGNALPTSPTRLAYASEETKCRSSCSGSASHRKQPEHALGLHRRFPTKGVSTRVLDPRCLRTERRHAISASSLGDEGPSLNRNEVVELLSVAVYTLLRPENQKRLRERLEKIKQPTQGGQSKVVEQPSHGDRWSSPPPTNSLEVLDEVRHVDMELDATDSGRYPSDQVSLISTSVNIPSTSQSTELVELEGQSQSIETMGSSPGRVEGNGDSSLTSIRRLKVLNVHSYVHNALRESALRSWLNSRTIEE